MARPGRLGLRRVRRDRSHRGLHRRPDDREPGHEQPGVGAGLRADRLADPVRPGRGGQRAHRRPCVELRGGRSRLQSEGGRPRRIGPAGGRRRRAPPVRGGARRSVLAGPPCRADHRRLDPRRRVGRRGRHRRGRARRRRRLRREDHGRVDDRPRFQPALAGRSPGRGAQVRAPGGVPRPAARLRNDRGRSRAGPDGARSRSSSRSASPCFSARCSSSRSSP